jgi:predicted DsbA family dithiol-disulfide isomerase
MMASMSQLEVVYFSDLLCVWAYIAEARVEQLRADFPDAVRVVPRTVSVFGDVAGKLRRGWSERGGAAGYAAHVRQTLEGFGHVSLHPDTWLVDVPASSLPAHLFALSARPLEASGELPPGSEARLAWELRRAFFAGARNVARLAVQREVAEELGLPVARLEASLAEGLAHAAFAEDLELVKSLGVTLSPTLVLDEGRQRLNGNVGYRVIEANVRELLQARAPGAASWC